MSDDKYEYARIEIDTSGPHKSFVETVLEEETKFINEIQLDLLSSGGEHTNGSCMMEQQLAQRLYEGI